MYNELKKTWWNKPLIGKKSLTATIKFWWLKSFFRADVPETSIQIYQNFLEQLYNITAIAKNIDSLKFTNKEFITFLGINLLIKKDTGDYKGLQSSIELLRVAFETKDCFSKIEATESRFLGFAQQEFYKYVFELLEMNVEKDKFKELVQKKFISVIPNIRTDEGKIALQSYVNQLEILSEDQLGLKLLFLFKQYDLSNFSLLIKITKIADRFYNKNENLENLKEFNIIVLANTEMFLRLGNIIQIPKEKNVPYTYALILQYLALINRHKNSYNQFQQLIKFIRDWEKFYDPIIGILQQYPPDEYKQPKIFQQEIPGLNLYEQYKEYL